MPKRVVDGEGVWRSDKLAQVEPPPRRAEYANLIPLAFANGTFEAGSRAVWAQVYAFNRPDVSPEDVESLLTELERVRLLFRWNDSAGKTWGYWVGIEKPGRLPGPARLKQSHERVGPEPPKEQLQAFLESIRIPTGDHTHTNGSLGLGSGLGSGLGINPSSEAKTSSDNQSKRPEEKQPTERGLRLAALLKDKILINDPNAKIKKFAEWAHEAERLITIDHRSEQEIEQVIAWCQNDSFWKSNVLSMGKLRKQFPSLKLKRDGEQQKPHQRTVPVITGPTAAERAQTLRASAGAGK